MEYLGSIHERYHKAGKEAKSAIFDEFCKVYHYNRKYAIRLLSGGPPVIRGDRAPRRREFVYSEACLLILEKIWRASGHLCAERLKEAIPWWLPRARVKFSMTPVIEKELLSISARQIDNRLRSKKKQIRKSIYGTTRPGRLLKSMIPIRTSNWDIRVPGYLEMDTVAHCGNSLYGEFIWTLTATDIQTGWTERVAVMGKGRQRVLEGVMDIKNALPFRLRGVDSDNGDEFINYHLLDFCMKFRPRIEFTRGRENKKNDNPHVEQKNWTHVRQIFGWDRYNSRAVLDAMNELYNNELRLFQNLFQPSLKLKEKIRIGSKVRRRYDKAKTPLQRVLESGKSHHVKAKRLKDLAATVDPFELSETIDRKLRAIYEMASQRVGGKESVRAGGNPAQTTSAPAVNSGTLNSPWRYWCFSKKTIRRRWVRNQLKKEASSR